MALATTALVRSSLPPCLVAADSGAHLIVVDGTCSLPAQHVQPGGRRSHVHAVPCRDRGGRRRQQHPLSVSRSGALPVCLLRAQTMLTPVATHTGTACPPGFITTGNGDACNGTGGADHWGPYEHSLLLHTRWRRGSAPLACPANTFASLGAGVGSTSCTNCPANQDTLGQTGATLCTGLAQGPFALGPVPVCIYADGARLVCAPGFTSDGAGDACRGTSSHHAPPQCRPTRTHDAGDVTACPAGSTSAPGNACQCTCN
jgi:hypothetical protein